VLDVDAAAGGTDAALATAQGTAAALPLTTLEIKVDGGKVIAIAPAAKARGYRSAPLEIPARLRGEVELLADLVRESMDFDSRDSRMPEDLYERLFVVLGQALFDVLFQGDVRALVAEYLEQVRLRKMRLRFNLSFISGPDSKWLASLPWEYMHTPMDDSAITAGARFLSAQAELMLSRRLEGESRDLGDRIAPIKVLLGCASPTAPGDDDDGLLRVHAQSMQQTLQALEDDEFIDLEVLVDENPPSADEAPPGYVWQATRDAFIARVTEVEPVLIHFIGHGRRCGRNGQLAFSMSNGKPDWLGEDEFAAIACTSASLRAVFLQACESALPDPYVGFSGVAQRLASEGIPAVVAMQYRIAAATADRFAASFYGALANDAPIDVAVAAGRRDMLMKVPEAWKQMSFGLPVLYLSQYGSIVKRGPSSSYRAGVLTSPSSEARAIDFKGTCANCQAPFLSGALYCATCGERLAPYCYACGAFHTSDPGRFCRFCGTKVGDAPPRTDTVETEESEQPTPDMRDAFEGPGATR
jgi:hypothetical protein